MTPLVETSHLSVTTLAGDTIVQNIELTIAPGEIVGVIGESGSGKSMTLKAVAGLLPSGVKPAGSVRFRGEEIMNLSRKQYREFRDRELGIVYQDPRASVNPVHTIADFLIEALRVNRRVAKKDALQRARQSCKEVGLADPDRILGQYPHQLSGGMLQRVVIAAALLTEPQLILADEPTTALDVTRQAEVVALLRDQVRKKNLGMMFITHDLELATALCDRVYVMYQGRIVDEAHATELHLSSHPYTQALLAARPHIGQEREELFTITDELRQEIDMEVFGK